MIEGQDWEEVEREVAGKNSEGRRVGGNETERNRSISKEQGPAGQ